MRLLLTSDFFHPQIGGAERQVQLLAAALTARGHFVEVATVRQANLSARETVDGVPVHRLSAAASAFAGRAGNPDRFFLPPAPDLRLAAGLRKVIRRHRSDVVHASGWIGYSSAAAALGLAPVILSARDYGYSCAVRSLLHRETTVCSGPGLRKCLDCAGRHYGPAKGLVAVGGVFSGRPLLRRKVAGIHVVSRFVETVVRRDLLRGDAWSPEVRRIPDIVPMADPEPLDAAGHELVDRLPTSPFILFVGALQPHKGLLILLRAYEAMATRVPLVIIGTRWPNAPETVPGATMLIDVPHAVVMAAWERSLFGVVPSLWPDPLPGVVREAMTRGRPVIGSAIGGNLDMIEDGRTGFLVPPGDVPALAAAMDRLLGDPDLCRRLGQEARRSTEPFTAEAIAIAFEDLYRSVLHGSLR
jgi:glycosyltransferase involved in cell wall biosynthesis